MEKILNEICILKNPIQEYPWGSMTAIQNLLGEHCRSDGPVAELWMGAHPGATSRVMIGGDEQPLYELIERDPESVLGRAVSEKFSGKLPFLLKVLAVERPLSVQVHPNLDQARKGFLRENRLGIPIDSPERNYRDENHKPEMLCALTRFEALKGFRNINEIMRLIDNISSHSLSRELSGLIKYPEPLGLKAFIADLMKMDLSRRLDLVDKAVRSAKELADKESAYGWMVKLNQAYPGDAGVFFPLILNFVTIEPGQAFFVKAGEVHIYLNGVGIELMANSDNVVRGGLSGKNVDVPDFLETADFSFTPVRLMIPVSKGKCENVYPVFTEEFQLSAISVDGEKTFISRTERSAEILFCIQGEGKINDLRTNNSIRIGRGGSVIVPSAVIQYSISGEADFYKASVPVSVEA